MYGASGCCFMCVGLKYTVGMMMKSGIEGGKVECIYLLHARGWMGRVVNGYSSSRWV
jgi:hypothetical protein